MTVFVVIGIKYNKWKNTVWKGQIVEIEIDRTNIPKYKDRQLVLINGKALGMMTVDQKKIPFGCKVFASLETFENHVKVRVDDRPVDWLSEFKDSQSANFSQDFLNRISQEHSKERSLDNMNLDTNPAYTIDENIKPKYLYEWLIRVGISEKDIQAEVLEKYVNFRLWLAGNRELSEDNYEDEHIREYEIYLEDLKIKQQKDEEDSKKNYDKLNKMTMIRRPADAYDFVFTAAEQQWFDRNGFWNKDVKKYYAQNGDTPEKLDRSERLLAAKIDKFNEKEEDYFQKNGRYWSEDFPDNRANDIRPAKGIDIADLKRQIELGEDIDSLSVDINMVF